SKILYPSLRLGFLVAPPQLVDTLVKVRAVMDQHSPAIDQATLARFITEGFFLSHVKRIRELYAQRRVFFIEQFQKWLGDYFDLEVTPAGLHFIAWLQRKEDLPFFMHACEKTGVRPRPFEPTRKSERLVDATARWRLIGEARRRPRDEQLLERRTGLDNRDVIAPRECPILESLTSRAALFDIHVSGRRRHDDVREALRDYDGSLYRTVRRVLLKPSLKRFVRIHRQCWTVERRRQCLDAFRILGRDEVA